MRKSETSTVATWRKGLATSNGSDRKNRGTSQEGVDLLDWMAWMASRACPTSSPLLQTLSHTKNCLSSACHLPCASWGAGLHEQARLDLLTENGPPPIWQCLLINIILEDLCAGGTWDHLVLVIGVHACQDVRGQDDPRHQEVVLDQYLQFDLGVGPGR